MSESNVEIVRRGFELFGEGGVEAALAVFGEDVVIEIPPDMSAEPDTYRGHDGVRRYFAGFDGMLEDVRYELIELIPLGDEVVARAWLGGRGVSSGLEVGIEAAVLHEISDGKIARITVYPDADAARAAAG